MLELTEEKTQTTSKLFQNFTNKCKIYREKRKNLRGIVEKTKKKRLQNNREQMKKKTEVIRELKTGTRLLLIKLKKVSTFKDAMT